jgi:hypothetical protein
MTKKQVPEYEITFFDIRMGFWIFCLIIAVSWLFSTYPMLILSIPISCVVFIFVYFGADSVAWFRKEVLNDGKKTDN